MRSLKDAFVKIGKLHSEMIFDLLKSGVYSFFSPRASSAGYFQ